MTAFARHAMDALRDAAVPADAPVMQAYMKTDDPFLGVKKPARTAIVRQLKHLYAPDDHATWAAQIESLWAYPEREARYLAVQWAHTYAKRQTLADLARWERWLREGAWWDTVDDIGIRLVGPLLLAHRDPVSQTFLRWRDDPEVWVRRATLIAHLKHKARTDEAALFDTCTHLAADPTFWIRKAIGWTLREYGKTAPEAVTAFVRAHRNRLSTLSVREATKHLPAVR